MTSFSTLLSVHLISIALSVGLLTLRFWLRYQKHPQAFARWTRIVPPVVDTVLLLSGIALMAKAHILPFSGQAQWLTGKAVWSYHLYRFGFYCISIIVVCTVSRRALLPSAGVGGAVHRHQARHHKSTVTGVSREIVG